MSRAHRIRRTGPTRASRFEAVTRVAPATNAMHPLRTLDAAIAMALRSLRWPVCECGAKAASIATFYQLGADNRHQFINALPVCSTCAALFTDAIQIIPTEEAYAIAKLPVPPVEPLAKPGRPDGSPPRNEARADRRVPSPGRRA